MTAFEAMASIDGKITPLAEAAVPVLDRGFLYGDSIYEVFRTYDGVPLFYEEHWARFKNSADLIHLDLQFSLDEIDAEIKRTIAASNASAAGSEVYVRYVVTRGEGALSLVPDATVPQRLVVIVMSVPPWQEIFYTDGVHLAIARTRRNPVQALDPNIKGGNYMNNVLGAIEANEQGADDSLMLDSAELVTEASNSNVFVVKGGRLLTPSQVAANLKGLTKEAVIRVCADADIEVFEAELTLEDLRAADECFITSATREVMPVRRISLDGQTQREFPSGGGELSRRIAQLYKEYVQSYVDTHQHYSMY